MFTSPAESAALYCPGVPSTMNWYESIESSASIDVASAASLSVALPANLYDCASRLPFLFTTFETLSKVESFASGVVAEAVTSLSKITSTKVRALPLNDCLFAIMPELLLVAIVFLLCYTIILQVLAF